MSLINFLKIAKEKAKVITFLIIIFLITSQAQAFRFVVYSDCRAPKASWSTDYETALFNQPVLEYINSQITTLNPRPDFVIFMGDMINRAYPRIVPQSSGGGTNLDYWKRFMESTLDGIDLYVAVGNSDLYGETWWTESYRQFEFTRTFSNMPGNGPTTPVDFRRLTYSFEHGQGDEKSLFTVVDSFGIYYGSAFTTTTHCDNDFDPSRSNDEQITWTTTTAQASSANHKFLFAHGPVFSVIGYPVQRNVRKIWDVATANNFDTFFCAHEHLYYRWIVNRESDPGISGTLIQNLTGTSGAVRDSSTNVQANTEGRIHFDYTFVVVDVEGDNVIEKTYMVTENGASYTKQLIDTVISVKN